MEENRWQRSEVLLGKLKLQNLEKKHVMICGIGGVGSYALEALARMAIGTITIIDKDVLDPTNCNRQLLALSSTIGKDKVDVARQRILDINPKVTVYVYKEEITKNNFVKWLEEDTPDYIIDAVDDIEAKVAIIQACYQKNILCISCMGMGNKMDPLAIRVDDIYHTQMCPLAKRMRKRLKEIGVKQQKVVYSVECPIKRTEDEKREYQNTLGSVSFVPSVAGLVIASCVTQDLIKESKYV